MTFNSILKITCISCMLPLMNSSLAQSDDSSEAVKPDLPLAELQMFAQVFGKIKSDYVEAVDDRKMLRDAINGILAGLDPHSAFLEPDAFREMRIDTEGQFGGVGIEVTLDDGQLSVIAPIADTPADRAGVLAGDIIVKIDGETTRSDSLGAAVDKMRGKVGSTITLTIAREGEDALFDIEIKREIIQLTSVRTKDLGEPGFAYMRVTSFQAGSANSLRKAILKYQEKETIRGLILDLRNNPGGILTGAIEISDLFLDTGVIVKTHGRLMDSESSFEAKSPDLIAGAPIVILVNGGSASASEIVAGALQDHQRAIIFGTQTFGKGSVQTITPISNGSALKITTARYFTPNGRSIQETGITPDIISPPTKAEAIPERSRTREIDLDGHLANPTANDKGDSLKNSKLADVLKKDSQLRDALNLLKGIHLANTYQDQNAG